MEANGPTEALDDCWNLDFQNLSDQFSLFICAYLKAGINLASDLVSRLSSYSTTLKGCPFRNQYGSHAMVVHDSDFGNTWQDQHQFCVALWSDMLPTSFGGRMNSCQAGPS